MTDSRERWNPNVRFINLYLLQGATLQQPVFNIS